VFRRRRFFEGEPIVGGELSDIAWFRPDGREMTENDWKAGFSKSLGVFLNGDALPDPDPRGRRISDDSFLLLFNAHHEDVTFILPGKAWGLRWQTEFDTARAEPTSRSKAARGRLVVASRSVQVLRRVITYRDQRCAVARAPPRGAPGVPAGTSAAVSRSG
jgi:isoamylase